jgi:hypothetical protein
MQFEHNDWIIQLDSELGQTFLGEIELVYSCLSCLLCIFIIPNLFEGLQLLLDEDCIAGLSSLPYKFFNGFVSEDDEIGITAEQHIEIILVILNRSLVLLDVTSLDIVQEGDLGVYGSVAFAADHHEHGQGKCKKFHHIILFDGFNITLKKQKEVTNRTRFNKEKALPSMFYLLCNTGIETYVLLLFQSH